MLRFISLVVIATFAIASAYRVALGWDAVEAIMLFDKEFWLAFTLALPFTIAGYIYINRRSLVVIQPEEGRKHKSGQANDPKNIKGEHATYSYLGVLLSLVLAPAVQFALLEGMVGDGVGGGEGVAVVLVSLFGWLPGAVIGAIVAESWRSGSGATAVGCGLFSTMLIWTIAIPNAF